MAQGTELGGKIRGGDQVTVSAGETVEGDLYVTGGIVRVDGTVAGDLLVFGGQIDVTGEVTGDLMVAGGTIDISGPVGGDIRVAGGQISVAGVVGEDLVAAGGQVTLASSADVGEDLVFGTGSMTLNGNVAGDVLGSADNYTKQGTVGGTENVTVAQTETEAEQVAPTAADRILGALRRWVSILAVAALALWLAPRLIEKPADTLRRRPLASLGVGVLVLAGFVVLVGALILVAVLLAIVFGLLTLGDLVGTVIFTVIVALVLLFFVLYLAVVYGAPAGVGMALGNLVVATGTRARRWWSTALGTFVVVAVTLIPVVGGLLAFLVVLFGLGALILGLRPVRETQRDEDVLPTT